MMDNDQLAAFLAARAGKLTASRMAVAMSYRKDGKPSAERVQLLKDLLAERVTGYSVRHFVTDAMRHGLETEDEAKAAYEAHTGDFILPTGTFDHPRIDMLAATPDGLLSDRRLLEVKAPTTAKYLDWYMAGVVPDEHKIQMTCQCACTGRDHVVFVAYDGRIKNPARRLLIRDYRPTAEEIATVETAAESFLTELDAMFSAFTEAAAA